MRGTRRVDITSMSRARMTPDEKAEVYTTCRHRGFLLSLSYSPFERAHVCLLTTGGTTYKAQAPTPMEAWRKALAQRDAPRITSLLDG